MSYDVAPRCPLCRREGINNNHTSNTRPIWEAAGCSIADFHDKPVTEIVPALRTAIDEIAANPEKYRHMEPANRWGTVESTLGFLRAVLAAMQEARSTDVVEVCR